MTKVQFVAVLRLGDRNHFRSMKKLELFLHPLEGKLIQRRLPSVLPPPPPQLGIFSGRPTILRRVERGPEKP